MSLPVSITGNDFARPYDFTVAFYESPQINWSASSGGNLWDTVTTKLKDKFKDFGSAVLTLVDAGAMLYIGSMARKVTLPAPELGVESLNACGLQSFVPKQMKFNSFSIDFLDDMVGTVYNFLTGWLLSARQGLAFTPLYQDTLSVVVCPVVRTTNGLDSMLDKAISGTSIGSLINIPSTELPVGVLRYPHVYPVKVERTPFDREGTNLTSITATFQRLPAVPGSGDLQTLVDGGGKYSFAGGFIKNAGKSLFG